MSAPPIPDGLAVCPAWCVDCLLDTDGSSYHRGAMVPIARGASVHAFAWQPLGGAMEAPTFTLHASEDAKYTGEELRRLAGSLVEYAAQF